MAPSTPSIMSPSSYRDMTPTSGRLFFSGAYFKLEESLKADFVDTRNLQSNNGSEA